MLWIVGRVLKGTIVQGPQTGGPKFSGDFVTPASPMGKDASKLTDAEKQQLLVLFDSEKRSVTKAEEKHFPTLGRARAELRKGYKPKVPRRWFRYRQGLYVSLLPLRVEITVPRTIWCGVPVTFRALGQTEIDRKSSLSYYAWHTSGGTTSDDPTLDGAFQRLGRDVIDVRVVDEFGATGSARRTVTVRGKKGCVR